MTGLLDGSFYALTALAAMVYYRCCFVSGARKAITPGISAAIAFLI